MEVNERWGRCNLWTVEKYQYVLWCIIFYRLLADIYIEAQYYARMRPKESEGSLHPVMGLFY